MLTLHQIKQLYRVCKNGEVLRDFYNSYYASQFIKNCGYEIYTVYGGGFNVIIIEVV